MKENIYDDNIFFEKYSSMNRSVKGLAGAGEWATLKSMLPDFTGKKVLDLGCGFGWHCNYALQNGAMSVTGIDISKKMLARANKQTDSAAITYINVSIEDYEYPPDSFDVVMSSLAFHYIESFDDICSKVYTTLKAGGEFIFSVEHPIFTAEGRQDWIYDSDGNILCWPVDNYFQIGKRTARFLDEDVVKYHRTLDSHISGLLKAGFCITGLKEPIPPDNFIPSEEMRDEMRRPMMLIISAKK